MSLAYAPAFLCNVFQHPAIKYGMPSYKITIEDPQCNFACEYARQGSSQRLAMSNPTFYSLVKVLCELQEKSKVKRINFLKNTSDTFSYNCEAGSRKWLQQITMRDGQISMSISTENSMWSSDEFDIQRGVVNNLLQFAKEYELTSLVCLNRLN